jgi:hypothetical protein
MSNKSKKSLLNNYYPFFLDNKFGIGDAHYLYRLVSPTYNKKTNIPYFSLVKISEKSTYYTKSLPMGKDSDILTVCKNGMENIRKGEKLDEAFNKIDFINENFLGIKQNAIIEETEPDKFPYFELKEEDDSNEEIQKSLIVGIRSYLRWKNYRLFIGKKVDILITMDEFIVADIKGNDEFVWLEPIALYKNNDIGMVNPLPLSEKFKINLSWKKEEAKPSEINKLINKFEFDSFDRKSILEILPH